LHCTPPACAVAKEECITFKLKKMKKLEMNQMEMIEGGSWACMFAGAAYVLGGAATVLSGGAAAPVALALLGGVAAVASNCASELGFND
jgi:hypothetical protein